MSDPQTIVRDGSGAQTASYQLPPGLFQYIESVLVQVDNTAGGDARPTLQVQTVNGVVMAAKRQGESIPAGDTGTATWALRLTDEGGGGGGGFTVEQGFYDVGSTVVTPNNTTALAIAYNSGVALLDLTNPLQPAYLFDGFHVVSASVSTNGSVAKANKTAVLYLDACTVAFPFAFAGGSTPLDSVTVNPSMN